MKKIEMHCHTSPVSTCSRSSAERLGERYAACGFDAVLLTNHYSDAYPQSYGVSFDEWLDVFIGGYKNFADCCRERGIEAWLGAEVSLYAPYSEYMREHYPEDFLRENYADYLLVGATEEFFRSSPNLCRLDQKTLYETCKASGVLVYQAHPFRSVQGHSPKDFRYVDGLEVNGCCGFTSIPTDVNEDKINELADEYGLSVVAGGDTHYDWHKLQTATFVPDDVRSAVDLAEYLRRNKRPSYTLCGDDPTAAEKRA